MHRMYENDDIVIFWNSEKCFHAKQCVHGSPRTFNPNRKPWICLDGSDTKEVWQAISTALTPKVFLSMPRRITEFPKHSVLTTKP